MGEINENVSSSVSHFFRPYLLPSTAHSFLSLLISHLLISSLPLSFSLFISPPSVLLPLLSSPTYLICIHLLPDHDVSYNNKLPHLPPPSFPSIAPSLSSITALPSPAAFPSALLPSHPCILHSASLLSLSCFPLPFNNPIFPSLIPSVLWRRLFAWFCDL